MMLNVKIMVIMNKNFMVIIKIVLEINLVCNKGIKFIWISFIVINNIFNNLIIFKIIKILINLI